MRAGLSPMLLLAAALPALAIGAGTPRSLPSGRTAVQLGDLLLSEEQAMAAGSGRSISFGTAWPGGIVYFEFNPNVSESRRALARTSMAQWSQDTAIRPVESVTAPNRILISDDPGNVGCGSSALGMVGDVQDLLIRCWNAGTIAHEFGHALGVDHEHQRGDRNGFVGVEDVNGLQAAYPDLWNVAFAPVSGGSINSAYDYASVMHYPRAGSFTISGVTYTVNLLALGAQPPGPPAGSEAACSTASDCTALLGSDNASLRDLYGQALRYGRRVDREDAGRSLRGSLAVSGHIESCGSDCWRVPAETQVSVTLTPDPGQIAVLGGRDCSVRGRGSIQCTLVTDRNRRFTAFTFALASLPQFDAEPLAEDLFDNGFE